MTQYADHEFSAKIPPAHTVGYAHKAACALRDWALGRRGLDTIVSHIEPGNLGSQRLAQRRGGTIAATARNLACLTCRFTAPQVMP